MRTLPPWVGPPVVLALALLSPLLDYNPIGTAQAYSSGTVVRGTITPHPMSATRASAPSLTAAQLTAMRLRQEQLRERMLTGANATPPGQVRAASRVPATTVAPVARVHGDPTQLIVARNPVVPLASDPALGSTYNTPAGANNGAHIYAAGNIGYVGFSTNGGVTWTSVAPLPAGPSDAPIPFGDQNFILDNARRALFHSVVYTDAGINKGIVRIYVLRAFNFPANCFYDIDSSVDFGGTWYLDRPQLGVTSNFLFLATNEVPRPIGTAMARMRRINVNQLTDCIPASVDFFSWSAALNGQKIWAPARGTSTQYNMYWVQHDDASTLRLFRWREADASPTNVTRTVDTATFGVLPSDVPDCRGGSNNTTWIPHAQVNIAGVGLRAAYGRGRLAVYWSVMPDASHTQAHIHAAVYREDPLPGATTWNPILLSQPHIFNSAFCIGFPTVSANERGDFGIVLAQGGKVGGGGSAVSPAVGVSDDVGAGGTDGFFGTILPSGGGTHNPSDGRYGDYLTIHMWQPCGKFFGATAYALVGGTAVSNVEMRWTEFGRNRDYRCWSQWANRRPILQP